jgi:ribosomal 30S subunit maturation factor RimM
LIPFAAAICIEVDIDGKLIKIDPPEGLLDF